MMKGRWAWIGTLAALSLLAAPGVSFAQDADTDTDASETTSEVHESVEAAAEAVEEEVLASAQALEEEAQELAAAAEGAAGESEPRRRSVQASRIDVIGAAPEELESVPGSASVVTEEELESQVPVSANEVLRTLPGVHVQDEDGMGLRPNIGLRGLNPSRSSSLLVLEDGVPIALAPYGEPQLYYAPAIERMERLELVKGSGSILYGPQTVGGVLNYLTAEPPEDFRVSADLRAGNFGYLHGQVSVGDTIGRLGYSLSALHQRFEGHRGLNLKLTDVTGKVRYQLTDVSSVALKLHFYDEISNATYLGLTSPQFEADPSANFAVNDELPVRRFAASATYNHLLGDQVLFQTTVYGHNITRNWNRQDYDREDEGRDYDRIIDGQGRDITSASARPDDGSAIYFRDTMSSRNREFFIAGIEPRATIDYAIGDIDNELVVGARVHGELTLEERVDSEVANPESTTLRAAETRRGLGIAAYAQNRFIINDRLKISPGLRLESFWNEREITRDRVGGTPTDLDPSRVNNDTIVAVIPGLGISYGLSDSVTAFAGVHRGFAPPRTKDAVTSDGDLLELDAEYSWNYELGLRAQLQNYLSTEISGFYLDFANQIIAPTEASGAVANDPVLSALALVNSGETTHAGAEAQLTYDVATQVGLGFELPLSVAYTYVHSVYGEGWDESITGNKLPYSPEHRVSGHLRFVHPVGVSAQVNGHYVTEQFTDNANTVEASTDGLVGRIDPYFLLDARLGYTIKPWGVTAYVAGKNLLDHRYIASRAPQGIQPGMFRQVFGGIRGEF
ncbi:Fe3+-dicitrate receptor [Lujinxingia litoralis]|uniref:Fe3+-dicitrate receptor n=1 Tax=Lujinxingia litoralis TaxID=2211119 RepID=A0A328C8F7_9DELT|nr:TonB-dependent receptor [Lujinxingia litoralis]RAL23850.1 Fe3+-dicitrate receptor [Lujinxingia litoralis]